MVGPRAAMAGPPTTQSCVQTPIGSARSHHPLPCGPTKGGEILCNVSTRFTSFTRWPMNARAVISVSPFAAFAVLLSCRDIGYDYLFSKSLSPLLFAAITTSVVSVVAAILGWRDILTKHMLRLILTHGNWLRVLVLGVTVASVYWITFHMVSAVGAGLFNLIDYGLTPLFTAIAGVVVFKERPGPRIWIGWLVYLSGIVMLFGRVPSLSLVNVGIAACSPIATTISDSMSKRLLTSTQCQFTRNQVLVCRFAFAAPLLWCLVAFRWPIDAPTATPLASTALGAIVFLLACGYGPLWFLMRGLQKKQLVQLSAWEFAIPLLTLIGTVPLHHEVYLRPMVAAGAFLVLGSIALTAFASGDSNHGPCEK